MRKSRKRVSRKRVSRRKKQYKITRGWQPFSRVSLAGATYSPNISLLPVNLIDEAKYSDDDVGKKRYGTHRTKYRIGCESIGKLGQACGLDSITDLDDCAGKFVKVTLIDKKGWINLDKAEPYGIAKPVLALKQPKQEPAPKQATEQATEQEMKDDIPF